ncbi:MAG: hypothetical protein KGJ23_01560 [Euryarchaeota archaeon]|nr:hypothetical protein [Euryarchaeota archaeon]MDE1835282.1 hypothetical protein [Euryarchaeota archaeon]MDE1881059.1 hypothetical protein [Euryarchaeota archaeon]MDE2043578.1 hypothetical protein [Thermoplasmata archaeon]
MGSEGEASEGATDRSGPTRPRGKAWRGLPTWWPSWPPWLSQVRLLVLVLGAAGVQAAFFMGPTGPGLALAQLGLFPLASGGADVIIARYRWGAWRVPWNGMATGLFVALVLPPQGSGIGPGAPLLLDGAILSVIAILGKHVLRWRSHPILNPAASAMLLGGAVLGLAPAWWGTIGPQLSPGTFFPVFVVGGILVNARTWRRWTLPAAFFATYAAGVTVQRALSFAVMGQGFTLPILLNEVVDPATLFFALFMVVEPRTAPSAPHAWPLYGGIVGAVAALLTITVPALGAQTTIGPFSLLIALAIGNLFGILLRRPRSDTTEAKSSAARSKGARSRSLLRLGSQRNRARWGFSEGVLASTLGLILLGYAFAATPPAPAVGVGSLTASSLSCGHDNASIPKSQLASLHYLLGPSVVFWYDNQTGYTVFYDPINDVTVYETDLYEDHGAAEWNGDDYIVAHGCRPMTGPQARGGG